MSPSVLLFLLVGSGVVVCLAGGLLVGWLIARNRAQGVELQLAWSQVESAPSSALEIFERQIRRHPPSSKRRDQALGRLHLGAALCQIRLQRFDDAAESLEQAQTNSKLSAEDSSRLCSAYLAVDPTPLPPQVIDTYADYLTLAEKQRLVDVSRQVRAALERALCPDDNAPAEQFETAIDIGQRLLETLPDADWVQLALGQAHGKLGQWKQAIAVLKKAVSAHPERVDCQQALGRAHRAARQPREARAAFLEAHRLAGTPESAQQAGLACLDCLEPFSAAENRVAEGRSPAALALALLEQGVGQGQASAAGWAAIGRARAALGQHAEAVSSFEKALAQDARPVTLAYLGRSQMALGNREAARQSCARALEGDARVPEVVQLAGDLAYVERDYRRALEYYRQLDPEALSLPVRDRMARCLVETGDPAAALPLLQDRPRLEATASLILGRAQARLGQWPEALGALLQHDARQQTPEYRYYLANALAANGNYEEAAPLLEALLGDATWGARASRCLGHVKVKSGDLAGARTCYARSDRSVYDLARVALLEGDASTAQRNFATPGNPAEKLGLALAQVQLGDDAAIRALAGDETLGPWAVEPLADAAFEERNYPQSVELYERAIQKRARVSSRILCRLAVGYLQLNRHKDALPHLVELVRRFPSTVAPRYNLAVCRFRLGQGHFRQKRWDLAREEFVRCGQLLGPIAQAESEASAVRQWELEATYRAASTLLLAEPPRELERALQLFRSGAQVAASDPRWQLGCGLASALLNQHEQAASHFAEGKRLLPARVCFALGQGLSLLETDTALARTTLASIGPASSHYGLVARLGLVIAHSRDRQWAEAAQILEPLILHPLVRGSSRISPTDLAQVAVAYFALGGDRDKAGELANRHLPGGQAIGQLLIGLVQAESGDYAGAADTLEQAYAQQRTPTVRELILGCLLAAAAERILAQDLETARTLVDRALGHDAGSVSARRLVEALSFNQHFRDLDMKQIDKAIVRCEELVKSPEPSMQLVRTLGVLYHRRALSREARGRNSQPFWDECLDFWGKNILDSGRFWARFQEEYNTGKGRREQVKPEDVTKWRETLPGLFARGHAGHTGRALKERDAEAARRHLELIWKWQPDFEPPKDFLASEVGEIDEEMVEVLTDLCKQVKNKTVRETLGQLAGSYWNRQGAESLAEAVNANTVSVRQAEVAIAVFNNLIDGCRGNPWGARTLLDHTINELDESLQHSRRARDRLQDAKRYIDKACELGPNFKVFQENREHIRTFQNTVRQNFDNINSNRTQLQSLRRQIS